MSSRVKGDQSNPLGVSDGAFERSRLNRRILAVANHEFGPAEQGLPPLRM